MRALLGRLIYYGGRWLIWPLFIHKTHRVRMIVDNQNKLLLVKTWIGRQQWELPGGGVKKNESLVQAARRELKEETGLEISHRTLRQVKMTTESEFGASYIVHYVTVRLPGEQHLDPQTLMILNARWFTVPQAIEHLRPRETTLVMKSIESG